MSDCVVLSDRMPAVALGRAEWTPDEARHLRECSSCQGEWELLEVVGRLGQGARFLPDPSETTRAMLQRLKHEEARSRVRIWGFAALAAAAIVAAVWVEGRDPSRDLVPPPVPVVARLQLPLAELETLQPAELDSVLRAMDEPVVDNSSIEDLGLGDLDSDELQRVLDSWEG